MTLAKFLRLAPRADLWIFGYGSLMWSPGFRYGERLPGHVHGFHRSLCVYSHRYRGTPKRPGLVVGLCAGGSCWGIAYRVAAPRARRVLEYLWRREMRNRVYSARFVRARIAGARNVRALAFVANRKHPQFAGDLDAAHMARLIAGSVGERGHNIEYLRRTLAHLHALGVPDPHLERVLRDATALRERRRGRGDPRA
jgi:cation transport protein ChaC